jgi:dephospho-CoA kinase
VGTVVPFIGLTGGLGAGKSTALAALSELGASVISSDAVVHELYEGEQLRDAVLDRFGPGVVAEGIVDRAAVAQRVFAREEDRRWLEGVIWPLVGARVAAWLEQSRARMPAPPAAVAEVPLLFEAGLEGLYDATIAIVSDEELRRHRAENRGHALVDERTARQLTQEEKASRATYVVHNDGSMEQLKADLSVILDKLGG